MMTIISTQGTQVLRMDEVPNLLTDLDTSRLYGEINSDRSMGCAPAVCRNCGSPTALEIGGERVCPTCEYIEDI